MSPIIPLALLLVPSGSSPRPHPLPRLPSTWQADVSRQDTLKVKEEQPGLRAQAKITPDSAERVALDRVHGGRVEKAELEKEHDRLVYSFDIAPQKGSGVEEVLVDAKTGKVVKAYHETAAAEKKEHVEKKDHDKDKDHAGEKSYH